MSKKSKSQAKDKRLAMKRSRRASQTAKYLAWSRDGQNKKSKRTRLSASRNKSVKARSHADGNCGNLGCIKCNEKFNNPWLVSENSVLWAKRFSSSKWRNFSLNA